MDQSKFKTAYILSTIIAVLAAVAAAGGLFINNLYRDNALVIAAFRGNDLVTLFLAVPLLVIAMVLARRGSQRAQLVWLGAVWYMLYNYAFYLFGAAFNWFFWIYVALFSLSIYALIFSVPRLDASAISQKFNPLTPVKWISGYMLFFGPFLGLIWIMKSLPFFLKGQALEDVVKFGHPTAMVYALDWSLLVPALVLGGVLLWKRQPWGYIMASILLIKANTYGLALLAMTAYSLLTTGVGDALAPLWIFLTAGCLLSTGFLLGNMQPADLRLNSEAE